ncbi:MAG: hypothetical protein GY699_25120 [Desulfobacteraceae bacterium]|nr:hypothetical protein [Desulfobacteraceae bacterium]
MKNLNRMLILIFLIGILFSFTNTLVFASPTGGGSDAVSVASTVHAAGDLSETFDEFNTIMDEYGRETDSKKKKKLLEKAKSIFSKLINQANDIESEVSILSKKKLNDVYSKKLDRVLQAVLEMKKLASNDMNKINKNA